MSALQMDVGMVAQDETLRAQEKGQVNTYLEHSRLPGNKCAVYYPKSFSK